MDRIAFREDEASRALFEVDRRDVNLEIAPRHAVVAAIEAADLVNARRGNSASGEQPLKTRLPALPGMPEPGDRHGPGGGETQYHVRVLLQIRANAGQIVHHLDAVRAQMVGRSNPGKHQELRRVDGSAAEDDLAGCQDLFGPGAGTKTHSPGRFLPG